MSLIPSIIADSHEILNTGRHVRLVQVFLSDGSDVWNVEIDNEPQDLNPVVLDDFVDEYEATAHYLKLDAMNDEFKALTQKEKKVIPGTNLEYTDAENCRDITDEGDTYIVEPTQEELDEEMIRDIAQETADDRG